MFQAKRFCPWLLTRLDRLRGLYAYCRQPYDISELQVASDREKGFLVVEAFADEAELQSVTREGGGVGSKTSRSVHHVF